MWLFLLCISCDSYSSLLGINKDYCSTSVLLAMDKQDTDLSECDYLFKIVLVGDSGTGKSCLTNRFVTNYFPSQYQTTIGVDFHIKIINIEGSKVKLQIWDTAGQDQFRTIVPNYYRSAHGIVLVYDCTDTKSYEHLIDWLREVDRYASEDSDRVIVGNKCDQVGIKRVRSSTGKSYAASLGIPFYETSAKSGVNVNTMFTDLAASIKRRVDASFPGEERIIRFNDRMSRNKSQCCI